MSKLKYSEHGGPLEDGTTASSDGTPWYHTSGFIPVPHPGFIPGFMPLVSYWLHTVRPTAALSYP
eukprot:14300080-Heterocapsa_arctica.AAC.1